jgi:hypothetical protein
MTTMANRRLAYNRLRDRDTVWWVETSLETVALAEPHGCWRFRPSALTEPA